MGKFVEWMKKRNLQEMVQPNPKEDAEQADLLQQAMTFFKLKPEQLVKDPMARDKALKQIAGHPQYNKALGLASTQFGAEKQI